MEAGGAVYARVPDGDVARLEAAVRRVRKVPRRGPLGVLKFDPAAHQLALVDRWGKSDDVPSWSGQHAAAEELLALSREVGEVIAHYDVDETTFAEFAHWRDGALVRSLSYGDGEWLTVEGEPQAWEAAFFAPARLDQLLELLIDEEAPRQAQARAAFAAGRVVKGASFPWPAAPWRTLRAPAYGFSPWPRRNDAVKQLESDAK